MDGRNRVNLPRVGAGDWEWPFSWDEVLPEHARRVAEMGRLYRQG